MIAAALEALVGGEPDAEAVAAALATVPAAQRDEALRWLAREHGAAALPVLRRCLAARPDWAIAAAGALGTLRTPEAIRTLETAEGVTRDRAVRAAFRRARYRLQQAGVAAPPPAAPAARRPRYRLAEAWMSAVDGSGARGVWLAIEGPYGERSLLAAVLGEEAGLLDFSATALAKKHLDARLRALRAESPLPWVAAPPAWAWHALAAAARRAEAAGRPPSAELARWRERLDPPGELRPPIYDRVPAEALEDPALLARSADLLARPELAGWFLDPASVTSEALEWLQARESRLVLSDQLQAERLASLIDRVVEAHWDGPGRARWQGRLEEQAYVLLQLGHEAEAVLAAAVARALDAGQPPPARVPFVRALVERSLEVAGEVATGRLSTEQASRAPRAREPAPPPGG